LGAYPCRVSYGEPARQELELRKLATDEIARYADEIANWIFETGPALFGFYSQATRTHKPR
jgi:hypothetical protein